MTLHAKIPQPVFRPYQTQQAGHGAAGEPPTAPLVAHETAAPAGLDRAVACIVESLGDAGTLYVAGNGGSAAHAAHLVAELLGRFAYDRAPLRAVDLGGSVPVLTCIANDYGYEQVFSRQVRALVGPDDVLLVLTTSGRSPNVLAAVETACALGEYGAAVIALTGPGGLEGGERYGTSTYPIVVRSEGGTAAVQESHQRQVHEIARRVEEALCPR